VSALASTGDAAPPRRLLVSVWTLGACVLLPAVALSVVLLDLARGNAGWAFREAFLRAADAVPRGETLYPELTDPSLAAGTAYVYPPLLALLVTPFTLVAANPASVAFALVLVAAVPATLLLLDVRDWRCHGIAFLWPAVISGVHVENVTLLMCLAAAAVWRFRDGGGGGIGLGVSLALKPLLWPLAPWLFGSGRPRLLALGAGVAVLLALGSWAVVGFDGILEYEALVRRLGELMDEWGYSVYALALDLGAGDQVARLLWLALAIGLLTAAFAVSRRGSDRGGFVLAMAAVIACSPIVWLHYFALLLVVVAVARSRLGWIWFVPLLLYGAEEVGNGSPAQTALVLGTAGATVALAFRAARREPESGAQMLSREPAPTASAAVARR
jgi:Glycosyltransferase family 87